MLELPNTAVILARLDPLSLEPVSRQVELGEYHNAWSLSPDRSQLALGISAPGRTGRIGIVIVDLETMKVVREIETGGAAEALAWLTPRLLAAALVRDGTVVVDPVSGKILRRWPRLPFPEASARTRNGMVVLFADVGLGGSPAAAAPRLAAVDARGRLRSVGLRRIRLGARRVAGIGYADAVGLAVDPVGARAYVFAADAPVAEVDLRTMRVSYHRLEALFLPPGELAGLDVKPGDPVAARQRGAIWLGDGKAIVFGQDLVAARGGEVASVAAGALLVDTDRRSSCMLDPKASGVAFVAGRVLVFGPGRSRTRDAPGIGLRGYSVDGRRLFQLFEGEQVWDVQVTGEHAYVRTPDAVRVIEVRSGKLASDVVPPRDLVDVVVARP